jgi:hypothetical protein
LWQRQPSEYPNKNNTEIVIAVMQQGLRIDYLCYIFALLSQD